MKTFEQLAKAGYAAYYKQARRADVRVVGVEPGPLPIWEDLDPIERQCWIEATRQIVAEAALVH